jgi:aspartyl-tRNA(Asn)/glutamyl-tRNA(Gln) amidotransferase subunit C
MSRITPDEVRHVARLAQLELGDDELEAIRLDLDAVLGYVDQLKELDVDGVEPTTHAVPLHLALRRDEVVTTLTRDEVLQNAPSAVDGMFRVPRVVEGGN